jgi:sialidase-1
MIIRKKFSLTMRKLAFVCASLLIASSCNPKGEKSAKTSENDQTDLSMYNIRTGIIYRNPKAHVFSMHAYFPSIVVMDNGEMLATYAIGEAFEAANSDTYVSRSADMGETWTEPVRLLKKDPKTLVSNYARIATVPGGAVVANIVRSHREDHPEEGLANPENIGFVPTDLLVTTSTDFGKTWTEPWKIKPPLIGPSFEMCSQIVPLSDGRWLWPTSTWRGWDGYSPNGMKMVALVSKDKGKTWPEYMNVMDRNSEKIIFWESKIVELSKDVLLAVAWAYDEVNGKDLPNQYTVSRDGGKTWAIPASTEILGETMAITLLPDGKILAVYRRMDVPGLWIKIVRMEGHKWVNEKDIPLWGAQEKSLTEKSKNMVQDFNELRFGAPSVIVLPDKTVYIAFWCYEKSVSNIRWFKLNV